MSPSWRGLFATGRAPALPPEVRQAVGRPKPLAACRDDQGGWLVGTREALHHLTHEARVWPWEGLLRAEWDQEAETLRLVPIEVYGHAVEETVLRLVDGADLLGLVRERVSASIVMERRVSVAGTRGFLLFARRPPAGGALSWAFELDEGLDPEAPGVREAMDVALSEAQASLGGPGDA